MKRLLFLIFLAAPLWAADYYVDPASGNNGNAGTAYNNAWATTQYALDNITAGDVVYLMNTATESVGTQIDLDNNGGVTPYGGTVALVGADSNGDPLNGSGTYTLQASAVISHIIQVNADGDQIDFQDITFDGNSNAADCIGSTTANLGGTVTRCVFENATGDGIALEQGNGSVTFRFSHFRNNGAYGIRTDDNNDGLFYLQFCTINDNGSGGVFMSWANPQLIGNLIYDNGGSGVVLDATYANGGEIIGNTFYGNSGSGLEYDGNAGVGGENYHNSYSTNGAYGIFFNGTTPGFVDYNHYDGNTTAAADITAPGSNNATGDPLFASVTDGSEDFEPADGSPLDGAGINGHDIGAIATADPAGGGGSGAHSYAY